MARLLAAAVMAVLLIVPAAQAADTPQPPLDISKLPYQPIGFFKPGDAIPPDYETACDTTARPLFKNGLFNPSGNWNAYDTNIFETLCLPFRNQDDTSDQDPWGNGGEGEKRHGYCAGANVTDPTDPGVCPNHQLEYIQYFRTTMMEILKDFSPSFHEYDFEHPEGIGRLPAVVVPGADHPDENIVIGSHYDQTTTGPASTWDSQEGHAEMIRVAKLMADYWHATGTRPSATIKFMPMDGEEDGTLGSAAYVNDFIVPDQESKVRSYWNADPCAGGYPGRRYGNPADMVPINVQIGDSTDARVVKFNEGARQIVEDTFEHLDDHIEAFPDKPEVFVSTAEGMGVLGDVDKHVFVTKEHPALFGSDWRNFIAANIPFFNPSPKVTGPAAPDTDDPTLLILQGNTPDALVGFHTPIDNLQTMSRYTGQDATGMTWSEPWAKGMEMCAHLLAYGMLHPDQGGAQTANGDIVAYYEAQPNEAEQGHFVTFDASSSYQYADVSGHGMVPDSQMQFRWDYGDGRIGYGKVVKHAYGAEGKFDSKLTVTNRKTGQTATMAVPVTVLGAVGADVDPASQDKDTVPAHGDVVACRAATGFTKVSVKPSDKGLAFDVERQGQAPVKVSIYRASRGRRAVAPRKVASFSFTGTYKWKGAGAAGDYYAVLSVVQPNNQLDRRTVTLVRKGNRFRLGKAFTQPDSCSTVSLFRLGSPVFGAKRPLKVAFALTKPGKATIQLIKGGKKVASKTRKVTAANRSQVVTLQARKRGVYKVRLRAGGRTVTLYAKRL